MKKYIKYIKDCEFGPKKDRKLKAVSFEAKSPIGDGKYLHTNCQVMEWVNGEGYEIHFSNYNQKTEKEKEKSTSLHKDEIDLILASLDNLKYFDV